MSPTVEQVNTWEMVMVHRVFRREIGLMPDLIRAVDDGNLTRAAVLAEYLSDLTGTLHHHHVGEDELLWPALLERASPHTELVQRMQTQHEQLSVLIDRIQQLTPWWRAEAAASVRDELADVIARASVALEEHLVDEENKILPLVARYVTHAEWQALGKHGMQAIPKNTKAFVFIGLILEDATPPEQTAFLGLLPPPVRWAWRLFGGHVYRRAKARIHGSP
jgi:hemerythrin-like domain-containing protein